VNFNFILTLSKESLLIIHHLIKHSDFWQQVISFTDHPD